MTPSRIQQSVRSMLVAVLLAVSTATTAAAQTQPTQRYFPETGHTVAGDFLNFFDGHGGLRIFGYPITDAFNWQGRTVQYFQRARMELHPENPYNYRVQLGLLGVELNRGEASIPPIPNDPYHRYYRETGHSVAYAFLNFFDTNGGLDIFGYPITEFKVENGRIVQYFQRARLQWHPELSGDQRVQLGELGTIHFDAARFDPALKAPQRSQITTPEPPLTLRVQPSVKQPITTRSGTQTLFVYVTDQTGKALAGATVSFTVRDGRSARDFGMPQTDQNGYTTVSFDIGTAVPGQIVIVEVRATIGGKAASGQTSYLPWY